MIHKRKEKHYQCYVKIKLQILNKRIVSKKSKCPNYCLFYYISYLLYIIYTLFKKNSKIKWQIFYEFFLIFRFRLNFWHFWNYCRFCKFIFQLTIYLIFWVKHVWSRLGCGLHLHKILQTDEFCKTWKLELKNPGTNPDKSCFHVYRLVLLPAEILSKHV